MCSVGGKPTEVKVRNLVAWIEGERETVIAVTNPILRGWVNYFRIGHSGRCFSKILSFSFPVLSMRHRPCNI
jgi:hypothetical protein